MIVGARKCQKRENVKTVTIFQSHHAWHNPYGGAAVSRPFAFTSEESRSTRRRFLQTAAAVFGAPVLFGPSVFGGTSEESNEEVALASAPTAAKPGRLSTALVYDEMEKYHAGPPRRPESPQRYTAILESIKRSPCFKSLKTYQSRPVSQAEILACHTPGYLACVQRDVKCGKKRLSTGDTWIGQRSFTVAEYAAGAGCVGVDAVLGGQVKNAFCLSRPPGHHATSDRGMGFCVFNNVAITARYAQKKYGVGKVFIIDWDVHHGNGTQEIFYDDGSVFYFSTHQYPWYPWSGAADETGHCAGLGSNLNCPLKRGAGRKEFMAAFHDKLAPAVRRFRPELILMSAGFDARHGDPLGRLELVDRDYFDLTGLVMELAAETADGHLVSVLEGGYNFQTIGYAAASHIERLVA
jgi:acetoin utilization deacetylase AcuC-like enzyme